LGLHREGVMPIKIGSKTFSSFKSARDYIAKKNGWSLKRAAKYVAAIERKENPRRQR